MVKKYRYYLSIFVIALILMAIFSFKEKASKESTATPISLEPISRNINGINMMIDPRIELLAAVQAIGGYDEKFDLITNENFPYKNDMKMYFYSFSKHEAVKTFDNMSSGNFCFDAPPTAMLYMSNPLNLTVKQDFSSYLKKRAGEVTLNKFVEQLKNFAIDTKFDDFYISRKDFYKKVIDKNAELMGDSRYIDNLEQYYGMKQNSYNIILSPMFHNGGYGPKVENKDGSYDVYSIQGPADVKDNIPMFGSEEAFRYIALHEFSHSFVNDLTEKNKDEVNKYSKLYEHMKEKMIKQAYTTWESCVNEHIVRAVVLRLTYIHSGKEAYDKLMDFEKSNGFSFVPVLVMRLEEYENNRETYKNFEQFYPELIKIFEKMSKYGM
jgi:hypothetical protein